jgi:hypothetical protein
MELGRDWRWPFGQPKKEVYVFCQSAKLLRVGGWLRGKYLWPVGQKSVTDLLSNA